MLFAPTIARDVVTTAYGVCLTRYISAGTVSSEPPPPSNPSESPIPIPRANSNKIIKVMEYPDIMVYNIMSTPGLVFNEKVVSYGRIPSVAEVTTFVTNALETINP